MSRKPARRRRCKRCNQLLILEANGEIEPHMEFPGPDGRMPNQCLPTEAV